jgi:DNA-directed RNA polymerase subunit F
MLSSQVAPRCYEFMRLFEHKVESEIINKRSQKFINNFEKVINYEEVLGKCSKEPSLEEASQLRTKVQETCEAVNKVLEMLPKDNSFPEFEDFIHQY